MSDIVERLRLAAVWFAEAGYKTRIPEMRVADTLSEAADTIEALQSALRSAHERIKELERKLNEKGTV